MSREFCRVLFATWTVALAAGVYPVVYLYVDNLFLWSFWRSSIAAGAASWLVLGTGMSVVLWGIVQPTTARLVLCLASGAVLCVLAFGLTLLAYGISKSEELASEVIGCAGWMVPILWFGAQLVIWKESDPERLARLGGPQVLRVACPSCGYNLGGSTRALCPECGREFTIAELIVLQPGQALMDTRPASVSAGAPPM